MKLKFTANYVASDPPGEVAVWLNHTLFLVLPAEWVPNPNAPGDEDDVVLATLLAFGDRLQEAVGKD